MNVMIFVTLAIFGMVLSISTCVTLCFQLYIFRRLLYTRGLKHGEVIKKLQKRFMSRVLPDSFIMQISQKVSDVDLLVVKAEQNAFFHANATGNSVSQHGSGSSEHLPKLPKKQSKEPNVNVNVKPSLKKIASRETKTDLRSMFTLEKDPNRNDEEDPDLKTRVISDFKTTCVDMPEVKSQTKGTGVGATGGGISPVPPSLKGSGKQAKEKPGANTQIFPAQSPKPPAMEAGNPAKSPSPAAQIQNLGKRGVAPPVGQNNPPVGQNNPLVSPAQAPVIQAQTPMGPAQSPMGQIQATMGQIQVQTKPAAPMAAGGAAQGKPVERVQGASPNVGPQAQGPKQGLAQPAPPPLGAQPSPPPFGTQPNPPPTGAQQGGAPGGAVKPLQRPK